MGNDDATRSEMGVRKVKTKKQGKANKVDREGWTGGTHPLCTYIAVLKSRQRLSIFTTISHSDHHANKRSEIPYQALEPIPSNPYPGR